MNDTIQTEATVEKFVVVPKVENIELNSQEWLSGYIHASFEFNGKTFYIKPSFITTNSYAVMKAKDDTELLGVITGFGVIRFEWDETMKKMSSLIDFDLTKFVENGFFDLYKANVAVAKLQIKVKLIQDAKAEWESNFMVRNRAIVEKFGGKISFDSLEEYTKEVISRNMAFENIGACFTMKLDDGSEIHAYLNKHINYGHKTKSMFTVSYSWNLDCTRPMKLETAIDRAKEALMSRLAGKKSEDRCRELHKIKIEELSKKLQESKIQYKMPSYNNWDVTIFNELLTMKFKFNPYNDRCQIAGIDGKMGTYSAEPLYVTIESVIDIFQTLDKKLYIRGTL